MISPPSANSCPVKTKARRFWVRGPRKMAPSEVRGASSFAKGSAASESETLGRNKRRSERQRIGELWWKDSDLTGGNGELRGRSGLHWTTLGLVRPAFVKTIRDS